MMKECNFTTDPGLASQALTVQKPWEEGRHSMSTFL